jgi:hypothetical protein
MALISRLSALVCMASVLCFAGSWFGALVDSKCYNALERNKNPGDTLSSVDRDRRGEIQYCTPNAKTKSFGIVLNDGSTFRFDAAGEAKAADLVRGAGKKSPVLVNVTGEEQKNTIKVDSVSMAR